MAPMAHDNRPKVLVKTLNENLSCNFSFFFLRRIHIKLLSFFNFHLHGSLIWKVREEKQLGGGILFLPGWLLITFFHNPRLLIPFQSKQYFMFSKIKANRIAFYATKDYMHGI